MHQMTALRFKLARLAKPGEGKSDGSEVTGRVEMKVYELGPITHIKERKDSKPNAQKALDQSFQTKTGGKKCIMSTGGTATHVKKASKQSASHAKGPLLQTVTLHYCTAAGLVLNNILSAPREEEEDQAKLERPRKRVKSEENRKSGDVKPEVVDLTDQKSPPETIDLT